MGLLCITAAIALFFFGFLYLTANAIASTYLLENDILLTEGQLLTLQGDPQPQPIVGGAFISCPVFVSFGAENGLSEGDHSGVEALRTHRMDFTMPIEGDNELKELAESINFLSETERRLRQLETELQAEKEQLIRDLSHDIRTPLTAMLSYSDYLGRKETLEQEEVQEYIALVQRKGQQIKALTDRLLDSGSRDLETIEDGKLLMEQLAGEWEEILENTFPCIVDTKIVPHSMDLSIFRSCGGSLIILLLMWKNMRIGSSLWNCGSMLWINAFGSAKGMESKRARFRWRAIKSAWKVSGGSPLCMAGW